jgi:hypothetical protein
MPKFQKGSQEMKDHMAKLRSMRKNGTRKPKMLKGYGMCKCKNKQACQCMKSMSGGDLNGVVRYVKRTYNKALPTIKKALPYIKTAVKSAIPMAITALGVPELLPTVPMINKMIGDGVNKNLNYKLSGHGIEHPHDLKFGRIVNGRFKTKNGSIPVPYSEHQYKHLGGGSFKPLGGGSFRELGGSFAPLGGRQ